MKRSDRELGMNREISRRDFLNGMSVAIGASLLPSDAGAQDVGGQDLAGYYPPMHTGMRGSHPGSFEVAHGLRDGANWEGEDTGESYDLVVVGGGISGLSAAYFYKQKMGADARILVLDNHDDFGGHAKRNEFEIDGRLIIGYGGTMLMDSPGGYPAVARKLIRDIGIDTTALANGFHGDLYGSLGLGSGVFFDRETFGADHLAVGQSSNPDFYRNAPLSEQGKADLVRLFRDERHYLDDVPEKARYDYLVHTDYKTYLKERAGVSDDALKVLESRPRGVWAIGIDALPARTAWSSGYPGFGGLDFEEYDDTGVVEDHRRYHFPDGNASIARLLVKQLVPDVAAGHSQEDILTARFDYSKLDNPSSDARIRLNSTVVRARHVGDKLGNPVEVTYVRDGKARTVTGGQVVMACYHAIIPRLCPEMPVPQLDLLSYQLRAPLVYTNVLIRNWHSFVNQRVQRVSCPGSYHSGVSLDFPVSLGTYECPKDPDEPIVLHLTRVPGQPGLSARDQFTAGKRDLLSTSFETFERNIRDQLGRILGDGGFDPARDIAAITVNRWPHGYAFGYDPETDRVAWEPSQWPKESRRWEYASERFGNISIAASDAASNAMTESAIQEAHRAITDLGAT